MSNTALITGANRGIGLALSKYYQQQGWHVIATCRTTSEALEHAGVTVVDRVDVTASECGTFVLDKIGGQKVDLLINNAGILRRETLGAINYPAIEQQIQTNALGPLRMTEALLENLAVDAKVIMITSRMGSIEDNTSGGRYGYRMSKAALNIAAVSLAHDLRPRGISVGIVHPGLVGTDMIGGAGDITPEQAAEGIADRVAALNLENSGSFWHSNGQKLPW